MLSGDETDTAAAESLEAARCLFYYLDALVRALNLACATSQAVLNIYGVGLSIVDFIHSNRTSVFAGSAAVTFALIYLDFNHSWGHLLF